MEKNVLPKEKLVRLFQDYFDNFSYYELRIAIINLKLSKISRMLEIIRNKNIYNSFPKIDCFVLADFEFSSANFRYERLEDSLKKFFSLHSGDSLYDIDEFICESLLIMAKIHNFNLERVGELINSYKSGLVGTDEIYNFININTSKSLFNALNDREYALVYKESRKLYFNNLKNAYKELISLVLEIIPEDYLIN